MLFYEVSDASCRFFRYTDAESRSILNKGVGINLTPKRKKKEADNSPQH